MKFNKDRYLKDRKKSYERSKNGELKLIFPDILEDVVEPIIKRSDSLYEIAEKCEHKRVVGCKLPFHKRTKSECRACL